MPTAARPAHPRPVHRPPPPVLQPHPHRGRARALGVAYGSTGYTTRAQADRIAGHLALAPGVRLADIGAGSGWPGVYFASTTGCTVVGTDLPVDGLRGRRHAPPRPCRAGYVVASGKRQPLRSGVFDAVVHTDVLCCLGPKETVLRECHRLLRAGRPPRLHHHPRRRRPPAARSPASRPRRAVARRHPSPLSRAWSSGPGSPTSSVHDVTRSTSEPSGPGSRRPTPTPTRSGGRQPTPSSSSARPNGGAPDAAIADGLLRRSLITASRPRA